MGDRNIELAMLTRMTERDWKLFLAARSGRGDRGRNDRRFLEWAAPGIAVGATSRERVHVRCLGYAISPHHIQ